MFYRSFMLVAGVGTLVLLAGLTYTTWMAGQIQAPVPTAAGNGIASPRFQNPAPDPVPSAPPAPPANGSDPGYGYGPGKMEGHYGPGMMGGGYGAGMMGSRYGSGMMGDGYAAPPQVQPAPVNPGAPRADATITIQEWQMAPNALRLKTGSRLVLTVRNAGALAHDFVLPDLGVRLTDIGPGTNRTVELGLDRTGSYRFFCDIPGHAAAGQEGALTVSDGP